MYTLYSMRRSGNCYKVRLALAQLGLEHELVEIDILQGESRTPEFLAMNPSGHVPLLQVGPGKFLPESNAILWFLADGTALLSDDPVERADTAVEYLVGNLDGDHRDDQERAKENTGNHHAGGGEIVGDVLLC